VGSAKAAKMAVIFFELLTIALIVRAARFPVKDKVNLCVKYCEPRGRRVRLLGLPVRARDGAATAHRAAPDAAR
jgi:hypothetical protein